MIYFLNKTETDLVDWLKDKGAALVDNFNQCSYFVVYVEHFDISLYNLHFNLGMAIGNNIPILILAPNVTNIPEHLMDYNIIVDEMVCMKFLSNICYKQDMIADMFENPDKILIRNLPVKL